MSKKKQAKKIWVNLDNQPITGQWDCPAKIIKQITVKKFNHYNHKK